MWCQKRVVHNFASHYWVDVLQSFSCLSHHFEINNMSRIYIHSRLTKRKSKLPRAPCRPGTWLFRWVRTGGFKAQRLTPANLIIVRFMCVSATIWCHSALYVLKYTSKAGQTRGGSFKKGNCLYLKRTIWPVEMSHAALARRATSLCETSPSPAQQRTGSKMRETCHAFGAIVALQNAMWDYGERTLCARNSWATAVHQYFCNSPMNGGESVSWKNLIKLRRNLMLFLRKKKASRNATDLGLSKPPAKWLV